MDFSQYKDDFTIRAVGVVITAALLGICIAKGYGVAVLVLGGLLIIQLKSLKVAFASGSDSEVEEFLNTAELHNSTGHYPTNTPNPQLNRLNALLNKLLKRVREVNLEREDDYQYLKNIVQHIGIGLITFDKHGDIQMFNTAARRLLKIEQVANVRDLKAVDENLVEMLLRLRTGGRDLLRLEINTEIVQLAIGLHYIFL